MKEGPIGELEEEEEARLELWSLGGTAEADARSLRFSSSQNIEALVAISRQMDSGVESLSRKESRSRSLICSYRSRDRSTPYVYTS